MSIDFTHHVIEFFLQTPVNTLIILLDVLGVLLDENVGDAVDSTSQCLVEECVGIFHDGLILVNFLLGVNLVR